MVEGAVCLALLAFVLAVTAWHVPQWLPAIDGFVASLKKASESLPPAMASLKEAADTSNMTSTESLNLVGSSVKLVDSVQRKLDLVNVKGLNAVIEESRGAVAEIHNTAAAATGALTAVNTQVTNLGSQTTAAIKNVDLRMGQASDKFLLTLDRFPPLLDSGTQLLRSSTALVDGPMSKSVKDLDSVFIPTGLIVDDAQKKFHEWLYPPTQSSWVKAYRFLKGISGFSQPVYYGFKLIRENP